MLLGAGALNHPQFYAIDFRLSGFGEDTHSLTRYTLAYKIHTRLQDTHSLTRYTLAYNHRIMKEASLETLKNLHTDKMETAT
jgi:hypothetical protein